MSYRITSRRLAVIHALPVANASASRIWRSVAGGTSPSLRSSRVTISDAMPCTFATLVSRRKGSFGNSTSYLLCRFWVAKGTSITSALGASGSCRDTITRTGFGGEAQISQPHFTGTGTHQAGLAPLARLPGSASHQGHRYRLHLLLETRARAPPARFPVSTCPASCPAFPRWRPRIHLTSARRVVQPASQSSIFRLPRRSLGVGGSTACHAVAPGSP